MPCDDRIAPPGTMDAGRTTMDELRHALRLGTRAAHERLERCFGAFNLTRHADYAAFLRAQAAALVRLEAALERAGIAAILPDWAERRRAAQIRTDLQRLGCTASVPLDEVDWITNRPAMLGATYVLEGSRLGGAVLRDRVLAADDPRIPAAAAFLSHGEDARLWQSFRTWLSSHQLTRQECSTMINSANQCFGLFEQAGLQVGGAVEA